MWKKKIIPFFRSEAFVLLSKFQSSCTLLGCEQRFLLPSQRSPTFAFHKPPDGVFSPIMACLPIYCCESCLVEFPLLNLALILFRIIVLAASLRIFGLPVFFLSSNLSFLDDHFTTQSSDFFSFLEISLTDKPVDLSIDAELFSINRVHLSWYSQNRGKIVSNSGHKIQQIFGRKT